MADNSTTRTRTRRPPRGGSVWNITETDVVDGREKKSPFLQSSTSAICLRPRSIREEIQAEKERGKKSVVNFFLSLIYTSLCRRFIFPAWIYPFLPREGKDKRRGEEEEREKEGRRRRRRGEGEGASSSSSSCWFTIGEGRYIILKEKGKKRRSRRTRCINRYVDRDPRDRWSGAR